MLKIFKIYLDSTSKLKIKKKFSKTIEKKCITNTTTHTHTNFNLASTFE